MNTKVSSAVCCILLLAGIGSVHRTGPNQETGPSRPFPNQPITETLKLYTDEYTRATGLYRSGKYLEAEDLFRAAYSKTETLGDVRRAARCLTSIGACHCALFQYREALDAWLEARRRSEQVFDWVNLGSLGVNLASMFLVMGDLEAAAEAAERAVADANRGGFADGIARANIELAVVRIRQGRMEESAEAMRTGLMTAEREGNLATVAEGWDHFGEELLARGALIDADRVLTEGFRLRKVHRLPSLDSSYYKLARLRLAEGDAGSALHLMDAILAPGHHSDGRISPWALHSTRGRALLALGRTADAFVEFRVAREIARRWRLEVLPADFTRVSSEAELAQVYSGYIEAGLRLYLAHRNPMLVRETYEAAEENRAASLHALQALPGDWREKLPASYWESLARLRSAEMELSDDLDTPLRHDVRALRSAVLEMEAQAGANTELPSAGLADRTRLKLPPDTALLSFHLGEQVSVLWAMSRERFCLYRLPNKSELTGEMAAYVSSVSTAGTETSSRAHALYQKLFGQLDPVFLKKQRWILALDGQLFHLPFAALVTGWNGKEPQYLLEAHSIRVTTGVLRLTRERSQSWREVAAGSFLGVGDAIYNRADPRWLGYRESPPQFPPWETHAAGGAREPVLARLAGTGAELESCAQTWNTEPGKTVLLRGADATPHEFEMALRARPSAIHIAAHFREAAVAPHYSMVALSIAPSGEPQWLSPLEVTRAKIPTGLVVLSGCSSGHGDAPPGTGLMGFTRAWLAAGARAVIASHWPTPDDRGTLFIHFYTHFRENPEAGPADALQKAQLDMLHAGGWRSHPQYWATYFVNGDL